MAENPNISQKAKDFYKGKYFIGNIEEKKHQFLHANKGGYEIRNGIGESVIIRHKDHELANVSFENIQKSFRTIYKIDCLEYLHNHTKDANWWQLLTQKIIEHGRNAKG